VYKSDKSSASVKRIQRFSRMPHSGRTGEHRNAVLFLQARKSEDGNAVLLIIRKGIAINKE